MRCRKPSSHEIWWGSHTNPAASSRAALSAVSSPRRLGGGEATIATLTNLIAEAIVNAANVMGLGGGGIDGIITRAGGMKMAKERFELPVYDEPDKLSPFYGEEVRISVGGAVITS